MKATRDIRHPQSNELLLKEGRKFTKLALRQMEQAGVEQIPIGLEEVHGRVVAHDIKDPKSGEVLLACNEEITDEKLDIFRGRGITRVEVLILDDTHIGPALRNTLLQDKITDPQEGILEIYRRLRPGDPPTPETATAFFNNLFFNPERYDLSRVGRLKLNHKLRLTVPLDQGTLRREDILEVVRYLIELKNGNGQIDDIDHLGNRRVRAVGELLENQYRIGLVRMERAIKERMSLQDIETLMPHDLINSKPVSAVVKEFFGSSQLSQFMDQTNPLSEVTHKRRLSALGPGWPDPRAGRIRGSRRPSDPLRPGLPDRDAGRSEHRSHRVVVHLCARERLRLRRNAVPARERGTGHRRDRLSLRPRRGGHVIAQANATRRCEEGTSPPTWFRPASAASSSWCAPSRSNFMDVSPKQLVSVAASLIPFLENDDANRALMGSNMQRQAVPLLRTGLAAGRHRHGAGRRPGFRRHRRRQA